MTFKIFSPSLPRLRFFPPAFWFFPLSLSTLFFSQPYRFFICCLLLSLSLPLSLRLDQSITRWRLTVPCRNQQVLWISHAHECTHVLRAVLIAVGSLSVCTYIFGGQLIELSFVSSGSKMEKRKRERGNPENTTIDLSCMILEKKIVSIHCKMENTGILSGWVKLNFKNKSLQNNWRDYIVCM